MKVRISEGHVRYRLDLTEVHRLGAEETLGVRVHDSLTFTLSVREVPEPLWTASPGTFDLAIPRSAIGSPSTDNPTIFTSDAYLVELDLKPTRP